MKPLRVLLALTAIASFCTGFVGAYNQCFPLAGRIGPAWFQAVSIYTGTAMPLVGVAVSIAAAQVGTGRHRAAELRGLHLGRGTLQIGALLLVVGLVLPVLIFSHIIGSRLFFILSFKLSPILIALGAVLLRNSVVALRCDVSIPLRILTLGRATVRTGFVLFLLGWCLPVILRTLDRGLGMLGTLIGMDVLPAGLALLIVGVLIQATERPLHRDPEVVSSRGPSPDPGLSDLGRRPHSPLRASVAGRIDALCGEPRSVTFPRMNPTAAASSSVRRPALVQRPAPCVRLEHSHIPLPYR
jgi:hypothetical protein